MKIFPTVISFQTLQWNRKWQNIITSANKRTKHESFFGIEGSPESRYALPIKYHNNIIKIKNFSI